MGRTRANITRLSRLLSESPMPVYAMDEERCLVYCNAACADALAVPVAQLLELQCEYCTSDSNPSDLRGLLCPPPAVFQGESVSTEIAIASSSGDQKVFQAECIPIGRGVQQRYGAVVVLHGGLASSERQSGDEQLSPQRLHQRLRQLLYESQDACHSAQLLGETLAIARVRNQVQLATSSVASVVVTGPAGSGRERIARSIHYGQRQHVAAPIAPLASPLLDAELLENTVASFVDSCQELETAERPALLFLEADQLPSDAQTVLAAVLQDNELGIRTLATARRSLMSLAVDHGFREDLASLMSTLTIEVPPLGERIADIPLLAQYFLERGNRRALRQLAGFDEEAMEQLQAYAWPGNVDELAEFVEAACEFAQGPLVEIGDLPEKISLSLDAAQRPSREADTIILDQFLADVEKELLQRAMIQAKGNKAKAARLLGVSRARILRRLEHFDLQ